MIESDDENRSKFTHRKLILAIGIPSNHRKADDRQSISFIGFDASTLDIESEKMSSIKSFFLHLVIFVEICLVHRMATEAFLEGDDSRAYGANGTTTSKIFRLMSTEI